MVLLKVPAIAHSNSNGQEELQMAQREGRWETEIPDAVSEAQHDFVIVLTDSSP